MEFIRFLLIGFVAGWVVGKVKRGRGYGLIGNIVVGCIGSLIGGYVFGFLKLSVDTTLGSLVMAIVGAVVLLLIFSLLRPSSKSKKKEKDE